MRYSKGWKILVPFILSATIALAGCAQEEASGGVTDVADALFLSEHENGTAQTAEQSATITEDMPNATSEVSEILTESGEDAAVEQAKKLTEEECVQIEQFLGDVGSIGFLLSVYERPEDLDAEQVFMIGAGLPVTEVTEEEVEAYLEKTGEEEAPDLLRLGSQQVSDFLQYRAGVSLGNLTKEPNWIYLEDYDAYYLPQVKEETSLCSFEVTDAAVQGDYYRVHYRKKSDLKEPDGWHVPIFEVILKKNGDSYRFCANRLWIEKDLLLRPYCRVELETFGEVELCAYEPDPDIAEADVTFEIISEGEVKAVLPGLNEQNLRPNMTFEDVAFVDTGDYDGDGKKEILTVCRYKFSRKANGRMDGLEARIYRFTEDGTPELDEELCSRINEKMQVLSLSGIAQFIKTGEDREIFKSREEAFAAEIGEIDKDAYDRFALIYINDDRDPELLEMGATPDKGAKIVFYNNGVLTDYKISRVFSYLSKENLLFSKSGTNNLFEEALYVYAGGGLNVYLRGIYGTMDSAVTAFTADGKPEYSYTWEGSFVTEAGYQDALGFAYNRQKAIDVSMIETVGAEEMLEALKKQ